MDARLELRRPSQGLHSKRMRTTSGFRWLLATLPLLCLMSQVNGQKRGAPRELKCVTADLQGWDCSWKGHGTLYEVCIEDRSHSCYHVEKANIKIPALPPGDHVITITSLHEFGSSRSKFILSERNVCKYWERNYFEVEQCRWCYLDVAFCLAETSCSLNCICYMSPFIFLVTLLWAVEHRHVRKEANLASGQSK